MYDHLKNDTKKMKRYISELEVLFKRYRERIEKEKFTGANKENCKKITFALLKVALKNMPLP